MNSLYNHSKYLRVTDALRLCVAQLPSLEGGAGRRILCLHGNPSHLDDWRETVPVLRQCGEVVMYDEPGFGRSERLSRGKPSLERSARIACALLDELGWESGVDVVGQSHGGMVALTLAAVAPSRVARLVLLGSGGTPAHTAYRILAVPGMGLSLAGLSAVLLRSLPVSRLRTLVGAAARSAFHPDPVPREFADDEIRLLAERPGLLFDMARLAADLPCSKVTASAARVTSPVLVVHGSEDALVPIANARRLFEVVRKASPASRFVTLDGGHMIHRTRPALVAPEIKAWFE